MPGRSRAVTLPEAATAFAVQSEAVLAWAGMLSPEQLASPSRLPAWTVGDVVGHLGRSAQMLPEVMDASASEPPLTFGEYVSAYAAGAEQIAETARGLGERDPVGYLREQTAAALDALAAADPEAVVRGRRGPVRTPDLVATRVLELVAHSLDLDVDVAREPLALICRVLVGVLAERRPGHAVELRVPPFAAAQVLTGTRHRRGTPPAVVEIAPTDWVRLATGRLRWADAVEAGLVRASGERSDLSADLPLLS